ncbi:MAG: alcohol dehydrogenase catalytic domain-containing protein [Pirellulales bacterium]
MSKTLVAVFDGQPGHLLLQQRDIPHPRGGEILVRIEGCTLCGSDLHSLSGRRAVIVPTVLGHEMVGTIESFGPDASRVDRDGRPMAVGDRIVWAIVAECGECYYCLNELPQKCLHAVKYGHEMLCSDRGLVGGLAEHCLLVPKTSIVRLPSSLPTAVACPAGCATSTVTAAMEAAGEINGRTIVVLGAGLLGLTACAMARSLDASQILSIDLDVYRRERAFQFGANAAGGPADLADLVKERTEGRGARHHHGFHRQHTRRNSLAHSSYRRPLYFGRMPSFPISPSP